MATVIKTTTRAVLWIGAESRPFQAARPCPCGCDEREGPVVGYVIGSDASGHGFTIYASDEAEYQRFRALFGGAA